MFVKSEEIERVENMFMESQKHPSEDALKKIEVWPHEDFIGLMKFVKSIWWKPELGFISKIEKKHARVKLHTLGRPENEDIIGALRKNPLFWPICWYKSVRGGHYTFKIKFKIHKYKD